MIGRYLSNTNGSATVSISKKNLELNKALLEDARDRVRERERGQLVAFGEPRHTPP